ncbi:hypothetical protein [Zhongshania aquimaris]|uniref:Uncharacterized protein n=1 Tax=Zhongshania aquimaris TaxID=2857107 RepID=A0ABS6VQI7_9GAMM|nr:hypothetical protein [Zhongshania aquimaris]MBW2940577.1 hypothetical protein [Zhongshania aquimaris]
MLYISRALVALSITFLLAACGGDSVSTTPRSNPTPAACSDNRDNDGDNLIDFPADPGCSSASDTDETDPAPLAQCADGIDNDLDGKIDLADPGCANISDNDETDPVVADAQCSDGIDNDEDGKIDLADPGCTSPSDNDEIDPVTPPECSDGIDNDEDGKVDSADPGCDSVGDNDETDPVPAALCADGIDNDSDGKIDLADPGCDSAADNDETDPVPAAQCADGVDNDSDGKIDLADPGCDSATDNDETDPVAPVQCADGIDNDLDGKIDLADDGCADAADDNEDNRLTRYDLSNACWAIKDNASGQYLAADGAGYRASAADVAGAEPFYLKPTALGKYMIYSASRELVAAAGNGNLANVAIAAATDNAEWTVLAVGDTTDYPATPAINVEPSAEQVTLWQEFQDPLVRSNAFTIGSDVTARELIVDGSGAAKTAANADGNLDSFSFETTSGCANFPEAQSNFTGEPFKGTQPDGSVLGHADAHVHISATEFLGGGHWGHPFHKFGVEHALGNCSGAHGETGHLDLIGGLFTQDVDGHATDGYPSFSDWPSRDNLTHEAIYWKWIERAWAGGLRVIVNDLVDNETLCELQRNVSSDPLRDCNSMNNAGRQAGTMYAMENYIDAQYGGPGKGFFQIVHTPSKARSVIEDGKIAVVLGIEISNLFDCKVKYNPLRQLGPEEEPSDNSGFLENKYNCTTEEGKPNSILTQMQRIKDWGVRQIISIHEFDNAFGGNGIFDGLILNLGNRENSGGVPSGDIAGLLDLFSGQPNQSQFESLIANLPNTELPTGEWWTTYNCPIEGVTPGFSGYLWGSSGGAVQSYLPQPPCIPTGQGGRSGGSTPCYPADINQCNARWMTPAGLYTYSKMMELGFLFDWDHMEMGMKTQALELAEAQTPAYPFVSTHGTFGGTTIDQATRMLANGGFLYPSNGSSRGFREDMDETAGIYTAAMALRAAKGLEPLLFGFGYGTDTNGLSAQSGPRNNPENPITYPFTLFDGEPFTSLTGFANVQPIVFSQPASANVDGEVVRTWHEDVDGNAHYGMLADFVEEVVIDSDKPAQQTKHLFNSAEAYLRTWELTEASSAAIQGRGGVINPGGILRPAPPEGSFAP